MNTISVSQAHSIRHKEGWDPDGLQSLVQGAWSKVPARRLGPTGCHDSRLIEPGQLFFALKGERVDGHRFLAQARDKGACAAVVSEVDPSCSLPQLCVADVLAALQAMARYARAQFQGPVVGVTGSYGKTSTKALLALLLGNNAYASPRNWNSTIGLPLALIGLDPDTHPWAVFEAGISTRVEMPILCELLKPTHAVITCVGPSHLEFMGSIENVAHHKAILAEEAIRQMQAHVSKKTSQGASIPVRQAQSVQSAPGSSLPSWHYLQENGTPKCVYFHEDCLRYAPFRSIKAHARIPHHRPFDADKIEASCELAYAIPAASPSVAPSEASEASLSLAQELLLHRNGQLHRFQMPSLSKGQQQNLVLALAIALDLGRSTSALQDALRQWSPLEGRGHTLSRPGQTIVMDAYNAGPGSMRDSISFFAARFSDKACLYLLGSMLELGPDADFWHEACGKSLQLKPIDRLIFVGPHAEAFIRGARAAGANADQIRSYAHMDPEISTLFTHFQGAILVKASRSIGLDQVLHSNPH